MNNQKKKSQSQNYLSKKKNRNNKKNDKNLNVSQIKYDFEYRQKLPSIYLNNLIDSDSKTKLHYIKTCLNFDNTNEELIINYINNHKKTDLLKLARLNKPILSKENYKKYYFMDKKSMKDIFISIISNFKEGQIFNNNIQLKISQYLEVFQKIKNNYLHYNQPPSFRNEELLYFHFSYQLLNKFFEEKNQEDYFKKNQYITKHLIKYIKNNNDDNQKKILYFLIFCFINIDHKETIDNFIMIIENIKSNIDETKIINKFNLENKIFQINKNDKDLIILKNQNIIGKILNYPCHSINSICTYIPILSIDKIIFLSLNASNIFNYHFYQHDLKFIKNILTNILSSNTIRNVIKEVYPNKSFFLFDCENVFSNLFNFIEFFPIIDESFTSFTNKATLKISLSGIPKKINIRKFKDNEYFNQNYMQIYNQYLFQISRILNIARIILLLLCEILGDFYEGYYYYSYNCKTDYSIFENIFQRQSTKQIYNKLFGNVFSISMTQALFLLNYNNYSCNYNNFCFNLEYFDSKENALKVQLENCSNRLKQFLEDCGILNNNGFNKMINDFKPYINIK